MIYRQSLFDKPVKDDLRTYDNIQKIAVGQGGDYTTGCFARLYFFQKMLQNDSNRFK